PMSPWPILANQGFSGIQGVGGIFDFGTEQYEGIFRMKAYIPEQPTLALKMLRFLDSKEIPVPDWVGQESSRCSFLNMDILSLFNNMGPLFDDFVGTAGVWEDTLQSLEKDEKGPKVNLKTELIAHLGPQISVMRTFQDFNEKVFIGVQIRDGQSKEVSSALHRMFDNDPDFTSVPYGGDVIWSHTPRSSNLNRPVSRDVMAPALKAARSRSKRRSSNPSSVTRSMSPTIPSSPRTTPMRLSGTWTAARQVTLSRSRRH
ncbi:MAG: hypothetical protein J6S75_11010, partial [Thermoguttaceae bacterium]|nr:hypothetical protein [Thermoguttaceae bacterium]